MVRAEIRAGVEAFAVDHPDFLRWSTERIVDIPRLKINGLEHLHETRAALEKGEIKTAMYVDLQHVNTLDWIIAVRRIINPHLIPKSIGIYESSPSTQISHVWLVSKKFDEEKNPAIKAELQRLQNEGVTSEMSRIEKTAFEPLARSNGVVRIPVYQQYILEEFKDPHALKDANSLNENSIKKMARMLRKNGGIGALFGTGTRDTTGGLTRLERVDAIARICGADVIVPVVQLDNHKLQARDAKGLDGLNPFQQIRVEILDPVTVRELKQTAENYAWTDVAIRKFGWKKEERQFTPNDALMLPAAQLDLPVRKSGVDPRGVFSPLYVVEN